MPLQASPPPWSSARGCIWTLASSETRRWRPPRQVIFDVASHYAILAPFREPHLRQHPERVQSEMLRQRYEESWSAWARNSGIIEYDQAGARRAELERSFEAYGLNAMPVPRDAHWKIGGLERRIATIKYAVERTLEHEDVDNAGDMFALLYQCSEAPNQLGMTRGFSPGRAVGLGEVPKASPLDNPGPGRLGGTPRDPLST